MSIQNISTRDTGIQHLAIQDTATQVLSVPRSRSKTKRGKYRLTLVIVLLVILGYLGSLMLTVPEVALTFDDGPNPYYTPQVLAVLVKYRIKATFFCVGRQVAAYPDLVRQEYAAGNVIGNHSWSHPNMGLLSSSDILTQINLTSATIQKTIGVRPTFFRPPYGVFNSNVLTQANLLGLTTVIWNDEASDWLTPGIDVISSRILGLAGNGAIILLHDGGGDRSQTVAALPTIIATLQAWGYKFVTLQQMVNDLPKNPAASQSPVFTPTPTPVPYIGVGTSLVTKRRTAQFRTGGKVIQFQLHPGRPVQLYHQPQ